MSAPAVGGSEGATHRYTHEQTVDKTDVVLAVGGVEDARRDQG